MRLKWVLILISLLNGTPAVHSWAAAANAGFDEKAVSEFYKGKTVRIIVGFSAGGGYDAYSRVIGRHLHKHIPGNPTVLVDNMAGAGSTSQQTISTTLLLKTARSSAISAGKLFWSSFLPIPLSSTT
jgi:hypothetical protein